MINIALEDLRIRLNLKYRLCRWALYVSALNVAVALFKKEKFAAYYSYWNLTSNQEAVYIMYLHFSIDLSLIYYDTYEKFR